MEDSSFIYETAVLILVLLFFVIVFVLERLYLHKIFGTILTVVIDKLVLDPVSQRLTIESVSFAPLRWKILFKGIRYVDRAVALRATDGHATLSFWGPKLFGAPRYAPLSTDTDMTSPHLVGARCRCRVDNSRGELQEGIVLRVLPNGPLRTSEHAGSASTRHTTTTDDRSNSPGAAAVAGATPIETTTTTSPSNRHPTSASVSNGGGGSRAAPHFEILVGDGGVTTAHVVPASRVEVEEARGWLGLHLSGVTISARHNPGAFQTEEEMRAAREAAAPAPSEQRRANLRRLFRRAGGAITIQMAAVTIAWGEVAGGVDATAVPFFLQARAALLQVALRMGPPRAAATSARVGAGWARPDVCTMRADTVASGLTLRWRSILERDDTIGTRKDTAAAMPHHHAAGKKAADPTGSAGQSKGLIHGLRERVLRDAKILVAGDTTAAKYTSSLGGTSSPQDLKVAWSPTEAQNSKQQERQQAETQAHTATAPGAWADSKFQALIDVAREYGQLLEPEDDASLRLSYTWDMAGPLMPSPRPPHLDNLPAAEIDGVLFTPRLRFNPWCTHWLSEMNAARRDPRDPRDPRTLFDFMMRPFGWTRTRISIPGPCVVQAPFRVFSRPLVPFGHSHSGADLRLECGGGLTYMMNMPNGSIAPPLDGSLATAANVPLTTTFVEINGLRAFASLRKWGTEGSTAIPVLDPRGRVPVFESGRVRFFWDQARGISETERHAAADVMQLLTVSDMVLQCSDGARLYYCNEVRALLMDYLTSQRFVPQLYHGASYDAARAKILRNAALQRAASRFDARFDAAAGAAGLEVVLNGAADNTEADAPEIALRVGSATITCDMPRHEAGVLAREATHLVTNIACNLSDVRLACRLPETHQFSDGAPDAFAEFVRADRINGGIDMTLAYPPLYAMQLPGEPFPPYPAPALLSTVRCNLKAVALTGRATGEQLRGSMDAFFGLFGASQYYVTGTEYALTGGVNVRSAYLDEFTPPVRSAARRTRTHLSVSFLVEDADVVFVTSRTAAACGLRLTAPLFGFDFSSRPDQRCFEVALTRSVTVRLVTKFSASSGEAQHDSASLVISSLVASRKSHWRDLPGADARTAVAHVAVVRLGAVAVRASVSSGMLLKTVLDALLRRFTSPAPPAPPHLPLPPFNQYFLPANNLSFDRWYEARRQVLGNVDAAITQVFTATLHAGASVAIVPDGALVGSAVAQPIVALELPFAVWTSSTANDGRSVSRWSAHCERVLVRLLNPVEPSASRPPISHSKGGGGATYEEVGVGGTSVRITCHRFDDCENHLKRQRLVLGPALSGASHPADQPALSPYVMAPPAASRAPPDATRGAPHSASKQSAESSTNAATATDRNFFRQVRVRWDCGAADLAAAAPPLTVAAPVAQAGAFNLSQVPFEAVLMRGAQAQGSDVTGVKPDHWWHVEATTPVTALLSARAVACARTFIATAAAASPPAGRPPQPPPPPPPPASSGVPDVAPPLRRKLITAASSGVHLRWVQPTEDGSDAHVVHFVCSGLHGWDLSSETGKQLRSVGWAGTGLALHTAVAKAANGPYDARGPMAVSSRFPLLAVIEGGGVTLRAQPATHAHMKDHVAASVGATSLTVDPLAFAAHFPSQLLRTGELLKAPSPPSGSGNPQQPPPSSSSQPTPSSLIVTLAQVDARIASLNPHSPSHSVAQKASGIASGSQPLLAALRLETVAVQLERPSGGSETMLRISSKVYANFRPALVMPVTLLADAYRKSNVARVGRTDTVTTSQPTAPAPAVSVHKRPLRVLLNLDSLVVDAVGTGAARLSLSAGSIRVSTCGDTTSGVAQDVGVTYRLDGTTHTLQEEELLHVTLQRLTFGSFGGGAAVHVGIVVGGVACPLHPLVLRTAAAETRTCVNEWRAAFAARAASTSAVVGSDGATLTDSSPSLPPQPSQATRREVTVDLTTVPGSATIAAGLRNGASAQVTFPRVLLCLSMSPDRSIAKLRIHPVTVSARDSTQGAASITLPQVMAQYDVSDCDEAATVYLDVWKVAMETQTANRVVTVFESLFVDVKPMVDAAKQADIRPVSPVSHVALRRPARVASHTLVCAGIHVSLSSSLAKLRLIAASGRVTRHLPLGEAASYTVDVVDLEAALVDHETNVGPHLGREPSAHSQRPTFAYGAAWINQLRVYLPASAPGTRSVVTKVADAHVMLRPGAAELLQGSMAELQNHLSHLRRERALERRRSGAGGSDKPRLGAIMDKFQGTIRHTAAAAEGATTIVVTCDVERFAAVVPLGTEICCADIADGKLSPRRHHYPTMGLGYRGDDDGGNWLLRSGFLPAYALKLQIAGASLRFHSQPDASAHTVRMRTLGTLHGLCLYHHKGTEVDLAQAAAVDARGVHALGGCGMLGGWDSVVPVEDAVRLDEFAVLREAVKHGVVARPDLCSVTADTIRGSLTPRLVSAGIAAAREFAAYAKLYRERPVPRDPADRPAASATAAPPTKQPAKAAAPLYIRLTGRFGGVILELRSDAGAPTAGVAEIGRVTVSAESSPGGPMAVTADVAGAGVVANQLASGIWASWASSEVERRQRDEERVCTFIDALRAYHAEQTRGLTGEAVLEKRFIIDAAAPIPVSLQEEVLKWRATAAKASARTHGAPAAPVSGPGAPRTATPPKPSEDEVPLRLARIVIREGVRATFQLTQHHQRSTRAALPSISLFTAVPSEPIVLTARKANGVAAFAASVCPLRFECSAKHEPSCLEADVGTFTAYVQRGLEPGDVAVILHVADPSVVDFESTIAAPVPVDPARIVFRASSLHQWQMLARALPLKRATDAATPASQGRGVPSVTPISTPVPIGLRKVSLMWPPCKITLDLGITARITTTLSGGWVLAQGAGCVVKVGPISAVLDGTVTGEVALPQGIMFEHHMDAGADPVHCHTLRIAHTWARLKERQLKDILTADLHALTVSLQRSTGQCVARLQLARIAAGCTPNLSALSQLAATAREVVQKARPSRRSAAVLGPKHVIGLPTVDLQCNVDELQLCLGAGPAASADHGVVIAARDVAATVAAMGAAEMMASAAPDVVKYANAKTALRLQVGPLEMSRSVPQGRRTRILWCDALTELDLFTQGSAPPDDAHIAAVGFVFAFKQAATFRLQANMPDLDALRRTFEGFSNTPAVAAGSAASGTTPVPAKSAPDSENVEELVAYTALRPHRFAPEITIVGDVSLHVDTILERMGLVSVQSTLPRVLHSNVTMRVLRALSINA